MKHLFWSVVIILISISSRVSAMPAFPRPIIVKLDGDNIIKLHLKGDENTKYAVEETTGFTAVQDSLGCWRYLILGKSGHPEMSDIKVSSCKKEDLSHALKDTPKGLVPVSPALLNNSPKCDTLSVFTANNRAKGDKVIGERKALIILAEFPDKRFHCQPNDFEMLFNMSNYSLNGATGSVTDYFYEVSEGQLSLTSTIIGPFTSKSNMSYYGKNLLAGGSDTNPFALFQEALDYAKSHVDLNEYDCNNDGFIDNIHIIYAGYGEEAGASANTIWAHECTFTPIEISPRLKIDRYSCSPELRGNKGTTITTIGPPCHEICHALGAMDYYDTNYSQQGEYLGTSNWDIMASGSWNNGGATPAWPNPYVRAYNFGWSEPEILNCSGSFDFGDGTKRKIYRVNTPEADDFFLLEYRDGKYFSSYEPGQGLLIFHIGPDIESLARRNSINATFPQQCYPVCASSSYSRPSSNPSSYGNINSASCTFSDINGYTLFNKSTTPGAFCISGKDAGFSISDIHFDDDNILFSFSTKDENTENPDKHILWCESFVRSNVLDDWRQANLSGHATWHRINNLSDTSVKCYLSLRIDEGSLNPREIETRLISPEIKLIKPSEVSDEIFDKTPTELTFTAKIRNLSKNTATWKFRFVDDNDDIIVYEFESELSNDEEWVLLKRDLPVNLEQLETLRLIIETRIEVGPDNKLELGELNLFLNNSTNIAPIITKDIIRSEEIINIFDLSGRSMRQTDFDSLPKGIYIIQTPSRVQKILVGNYAGQSHLNK